MSFDTDAFMSAIASDDMVTIQSMLSSSVFEELEDNEGELFSWMRGILLGSYTEQVLTKFLFTFSQRYNNFSRRFQRKSNDTLLSVCVQTNMTGLVTLALTQDKGIDSISPYDGTTPLLHAILNNNTDMVDLLLSQGSLNNSTTMSRELMVSSYQGNKTMIEKLVNAGVSKAYVGMEHKLTLHASLVAVILVLAVVDLTTNYTNICHAIAVHQGHSDDILALLV